MAINEQSEMNKLERLWRKVVAGSPNSVFIGNRICTPDGEVIHLPDMVNEDGTIRYLSKVEAEAITILINKSINKW